MNCWHCNTELIWGGDHDIEDDNHYDMVTNLSCPNCQAYVEVYRPNLDHEEMKEYKKNLEKDGVVVNEMSELRKLGVVKNEPYRSPDAPWLDDAIDRVDPKKLES